MVLNPPVICWFSANRMNAWTVSLTQVSAHRLIERNVPATQERRLRLVAGLLLGQGDSVPSSRW